MLIDTNPDLRAQCLRHKIKLSDIGYIFVTHTHSDHINGMGEFHIRRPSPTLVYHGNHAITLRNIEYFRYLEWENVLSFQTFETGNPIFIGMHLKVTPIEVNHEFPCHGFIVETGKHKISIITDTNYILPEYTKGAIEDSDILFIDGFSENYEQLKELYKDINEPFPEPIEDIWGHMTLPQATLLTQESGSKLGVALHISHYTSPHDVLVQKFETENFKIGYDGMELELP